jgi:hypothetical protein
MDPVDWAPNSERGAAQSIHSVTSKAARYLSRLPKLSKHLTIGRDHAFEKLTVADRNALGGVEYQSLKLLLKITLGKKCSSQDAPYEGPD